MQLVLSFQILHHIKMLQAARLLARQRSGGGRDSGILLHITAASFQVQFILYLTGSGNCVLNVVESVVGIVAELELVNHFLLEPQPVPKFLGPACLKNPINFSYKNLKLSSQKFCS
jgi:hypothetical protein